MPAPLLSVFAHHPCTLGESPVWDERRGGLFWLDILEQRLFLKLAGGEQRSWTLPCICSAVFLPASAYSGVLLASERGLARFNLANGAFHVLATSGNEHPSMRSNDGGVDRDGRIWFGTMSKKGGSEAGAVYRWSGGIRLDKIIPDVYIPNTFAWNATGNLMVSADSFRRKIFRYAYDRDTGVPTDPEVIVDTTASGFEPDGSAMDTQDRLWNAQWNGSRVVCYGLDGVPACEIAVPALRPTSCCFGGARMSTLFITTASVDLTPVDLARHPQPGAVFVLETETVGLAVPRVVAIGDQGETL